TDLANAYRALANGGRWSPQAPLIRGGAETKPAITKPTKSGPSAQAARPAGAADRRVLSAPAAYIVGDILSDRGARAPAFGLGNPG
ncbi:hypothetical protein, partial [Salmonella enterica]|uniref:hypothetical protein n=1 Tax=Salmonella enterica TaxID=28901 RepID=UPI003F4B05CC